jgi:flavin reductase (DIM6/NTAB) family NADH-FMN oxidoreductase RutF
VSLWTAGAGSERAGLTVSSLLVAEGDPAEILGLVDPLSELHELAKRSGRFLVHVLEDKDDTVASFFAGRYPVDPFEELDFEQDSYGPLLAGSRTLVRCAFVSSEPVGFQNLLRGRIEAVELPEATHPLSWYRGDYRRLT